MILEIAAHVKPAVGQRVVYRRSPANRRRSRAGLPQLAAVNRSHRPP